MDMTHQLADDGYILVSLLTEPIGFYKAVKNGYFTFKRVNGVLKFRVCQTIPDIEQWLAPEHKRNADMSLLEYKRYEAIGYLVGALTNNPQ